MVTNCAEELPVYWINLDKSVDRRQSMILELDKFTHHTRISATCPEQLCKYDIKSPDGIRNISREEYCCTISHLQAIKTAFDNGDRLALILEDDVRVIRWPGKREILDTIVTNAPKGWMILQMLAFGGEMKQLNSDETAPFFVPWSSGIWSTGAYIINRAGMSHIIDCCLPSDEEPISDAKAKQLIDFRHISTKDRRARCVADWVLYITAKTYTCTDMFFTEAAEDSTIKSSDLPYHLQATEALSQAVQLGRFKLKY